MSEPFLGMIIMGGWNFAPRGWALCSGQLLSISQNTALFSLLGTTYGGDGVTTFALPDLRGRAPLHFGQGQGLSSYDLGEQTGTETVTLTTNQMPAHTHLVTCSSIDGDQASPVGNFHAAIPTNGYINVANNTMNQSENSIAGGSQPHENLQPLLVINCCIALEGIFPSRN